MKTKQIVTYIGVTTGLSILLFCGEISKYFTKYTNYIIIAIWIVSPILIIYLIFLKKFPRSIRFINILLSLFVMMFFYNHKDWNKTVRLGSFYLVRKVNMPSIFSCYQRYKLDDSKPVLCFTMCWALENDACHYIIYNASRKLPEYGGTYSRDWMDILSFIPSIRPTGLTALSAENLGSGFYDIRVPFAAFDG